MRGNILQMINKLKGKLKIGAAVLGAIILFLIFTVNIDGGYAGVVYNKKGGIEQEALSPGLHPISPMKKVMAYPVSTETMYLSADKEEGGDNDNSYKMNSKEGRPVTVSAEFTYHYDINTLSNVYSKFRGRTPKQIEDSYIRARIKEASGAVAGRYEILDIYGNKREVIANEIKEYLKKELATAYITVEDFTFTDVEPDKDTLKAIQERVTAQQALAKLAVDKEISKQTAEKNKIEAEGAAAAALVKANGDAAVKIAQAQGEAAANAKLQTSLTPQLIEMERIKAQVKQAEAMSKWSVTTFINGGNSPLLNLPVNK